MEIVIKVECKETCPVSDGWYDTNEGNLYWFSSKEIWSYRDDRVSEEFPSWWLRDVKDHLKGFIDNKILSKAIEKWGVSAQSEMVIEECLELALALQRLKRVRGDMRQKHLDVIDEIADVKIMIRQCEIIYGFDKVDERVEFKMNRLKGRLSDENC